MSDRSFVGDITNPSTREGAEKSNGICSLTGAGHDWGVLKVYQKGVYRGECDCGAVRFFAGDYSKESRQSAELLNLRKGKRGHKLTKEVTMVTEKKTDTLADPLSLPREEKIRIAREAKEKGIKQVAAARLIPWRVVRAWVGAYCRGEEKKPVKGALSPADILAMENMGPVPPRPGNSYHMKAYYDGNKEAILRDLKLRGEAGMRKRWGISAASWLCRRKDGKMGGLAARWGLVSSSDEKEEPEGEKAASETKKERPAAGEEATKEKDLDDLFSSTIEARLIKIISLTKVDFPPFNLAMPASVQEEWLKCYCRLAGR